MSQGVKGKEVNCIEIQSLVRALHFISYLVPQPYYFTQITLVLIKFFFFKLKMTCTLMPCLLQCLKMLLPL